MTTLPEEGVVAVPATSLPQRQAWARPMLRYWIIAAAIVVALAIPLIAKSFVIFQLTEVMIYGLAILGLNLLTGFNGQFSLGHSAFYGIGAYTAAILMHNYEVPYYLTLPAAGLVCFVVGFLFGLPALRLQNLYLALATFALAVATPQLLNFKGFDAWTGGSQGLQLGKPHAPLGLPLTPDQWLYFLCLAVAALMFWAAINLVRGRVGRAIVAIRDHPIAAETMGVNISFTKAMCFGISALYAGVAGALGSIVVGFVSPDSFGLFLSLSFLVGIVVGGLASISGVLFGALFIEFVPNYSDQLSDLFGESAKALPGAIYGALLIGLMYVAPTGVAGAIRTATALLTRLSQRTKRG